MPAGLAFREGKAGENFGDLSPFLLHTVKADYTQSIYNFDFTLDQKSIRDQIYKKDISDNPTSVYNKNGIIISLNDIPKMPSKETKYGSKPYVEWQAYKNLTLLAESDTIVDSYAIVQ